MAHSDFIYCIKEGCTRPVAEIRNPPKHPCTDCGGKLCEWCCEERKQGKLKLTFEEQLELQPKSRMRFLSLTQPHESVGWDANGSPVATEGA